MIVIRVIMVRSEFIISQFFGWVRSRDGGGIQAAEIFFVGIVECAIITVLNVLLAVGSLALSSISFEINY